MTWHALGEILKKSSKERRKTSPPAIVHAEVVFPCEGFIEFSSNQISIRVTLRLAKICRKAK